MSSSLFIAGELAFVSPFLAIVAVLIHYWLHRVRWRHCKNRRKLSAAFCSSSATLGAILLFTQMFYRPSTAYAMEVRAQVDADEDDTGDPETGRCPLSRQLRRIRRGEPVDELVLRL